MLMKVHRCASGAVCWNGIRRRGSWPPEQNEGVFAWRLPVP